MPKSFCISSADTLAKKQQCKAAGFTHVIVQAAWDVLQPGFGAPLNAPRVDAILEQIADAQRVGLGVIFEIAIQYPSDFVLDAIEPFTDQHGTTWTTQAGIGQRVRNWMWTALGRSYVADFIAKCGAAFSEQPIERIRLGGGHFNELHYPYSGAAPYSYWAFGNSMQTGSGIASGLKVCPFPGYTPFTGADKDKDSRWINWYSNGLTDWMLWLIAQHKTAGFSCDLHVMHPGFGVRAAQPRDSLVYREAVAMGEDPVRAIAAYANDPQVWPWCTWLSCPDGGTGENVRTAGSKVLTEAKLRGKHYRAWGENSGDETAADALDRSFSMLTPGYTGLCWVDYNSLTSGSPGTVTLEEFAAKIATVRLGGS